MPLDVFQKIEHDFKSDAPTVHERLKELDAQTKGLISNRLLRSIIYLADGDFKKLELYIQQARKDWRDVLWQAEYDSPDSQKQSRDFNKTFHDLNLL
ncbi:hypothetical protein ACFPK9_15985 [Rubritalea spongiae]|uniref:Uncharacterized protein n=1 Tax=Rubritalea spongiae TaxID=430797 RepID=A0ABW5E1R3_9BACT